MQLKPVTMVDTIEPSDFKNKFYLPGVPIVIKNLSKKGQLTASGTGIILNNW